MTSQEHRRESIAHLAAAKRYRSELDAIYANGTARDERDRVGALHNKIRYHLQVAKIEAALASSAPAARPFPAPSTSPRPYPAGVTL